MWDYDENEYEEQFEYFEAMSEDEMDSFILMIERHLNSCTEEIDEEDLLSDGAIYYMNGNDGTDFDWEANDRTCEFMKFYEETEMGAIKLSVEKDGTLFGYKWGDKGFGDGKEIRIKNFCTPEKAKEFAKALYENFDRKNKYDTIV